VLFTCWTRFSGVLISCTVSVVQHRALWFLHSSTVGDTVPHLDGKSGPLGDAEGDSPPLFFAHPTLLVSFKPLRLFSLVSNMGRWPLVVIGILVGKTLGLGMVAFRLFVCNTAGGSIVVLETQHY